MKTMLLAAAAALSLGIGFAYAGDGEGPAGGYAYPGYIVPGSIYGGAQVPVQNTPRIAAAQNGQATHIYGTHSQSQGIWLFRPTRWAAATNANTEGSGGGRHHCRPFSFQRGELSPPRTQPRTFAGAPFCLIGDRLPAHSRVGVLVPDVLKVTLRKLRDFNWLALSPVIGA